MDKSWFVNGHQAGCILFMAIWVPRVHEAHGYYLLSTIPSRCKVTKFLSGLHVTYWVCLGRSGSMCTTCCVLIISRNFVQALRTSGPTVWSGICKHVLSCTRQSWSHKVLIGLEEINLLCAWWSLKKSVISTCEKWDNKQTCCISVFFQCICVFAVWHV